MISQEDIVTRIQQGTPDPNWIVIHPKLSYFLGQIATWLILFLLAVGAIIYYIIMPNHAFVLRGILIDTDSTLQTWRTLDFTVLGVAGAGFLLSLVSHVLDLLASGRQLLVLTPQSFFVRLRNKEYFVVYANVTSLVPNILSNGRVRLLIGTDKGRTSLILDNRFGKAKVLAEQIIAAYSRTDPYPPFKECWGGRLCCDLGGRGFSGEAGLRAVNRRLFQTPVLSGGEKVCRYAGCYALP